MSEPDVYVETRVVWSTITDEHERYASGDTREQAIENHLRSNRDLRLAVDELKRMGSADWEKYTFPVIRGVRRTVTVTRTEVSETREVVDLPSDAFGWERDGAEIAT